MATTREHPVPAHESDFMASVRVRPLGWVSFKKREVPHSKFSKPFAFPLVMVNVFKQLTGNFLAIAYAPSRWQFWFITGISHGK